MNIKCANIFLNCIKRVYLPLFSAASARKLDLLGSYRRQFSDWRDKRYPSSVVFLPWLYESRYINRCKSNMNTLKSFIYSWIVSSIELNKHTWPCKSNSIPLFELDFALLMHS